MPSAADLIFISILTVLLLSPLTVRLLGDAGIGWHIRTGQQVLGTHAIPRVDPFSSTMAGEPWFAWEWLYDVVVGQFEATLGLNGVVWLTAITIAAVFAWLFRLLIRRGVNVAVSLLLTLLAVSASTIHFLARPHVLTWLFTLAWFWILHSSERDRKLSRRVWGLPFLMLIWVNVHGGFLLGFVLLGIFLGAALWDWLSTRKNRIEGSLATIAARHRSWTLVKVGLVSTAVSLVNPYGWKLHAHIYSYLTNRFLMDHVDEFQSPNFHGIAQKCFAALLLITIAALVARGRQLDMSEILTILFAVYAGLYASRNIPVSSILLVMVVAPLLQTRSDASQPAGFIQRMTKTEASLRGHAWCFVAVFTTLALSAYGGHSDHPIIDAHFDPTRMPVAAVDDLEHHHVTGPVFSSDSWGGYLIYRLYPRERVVLDDRHDLYGEAFLKSYLKSVHGESGWQEFLRDHEFSCILLPKNAPLTNLLLGTGEWKAVYGDPVATLFVRNSEHGKP